jgi:hypothetical protein
MGKNCAHWLYRIDLNFYWDSGLSISSDYAFSDSSGHVRLIIEAGGRMWVLRGYSWNGCSPKVYLFDLVFGTPDGVVHTVTGQPKTYFASLVHDALYQFLDTSTLFNRRTADDCFLRLMAASDFSLRYLYWLAVRALGWMVWRGKKGIRRWHGQAILIR